MEKIKKTKFDIFLEKADKVKTEFKSNKDEFLNKFKPKNEVLSQEMSLRVSSETPTKSTEIFSKIITKEKMDIILDKFKNKNK